MCKRNTILDACWCRLNLVKFKTEPVQIAILITTDVDYNPNLNWFSFNLILFRLEIEF